MKLFFMDDRLSAKNSQSTKKPSLQLILISQFVVLIVGISGVMAWLSWRSEQETIVTLVDQLQTEISDRINQKLYSYLDTPHLINKINADAVRRGSLQTSGQSSERYLWRQIQSFPTVSWIYYGGEREGEFLGITRVGMEKDPQKSLQIAINDQGLLRSSYQLDAQGNRIRRNEEQEFYDARQRPWYQIALTTDQPTWTPIYQDSTLPEQVITASLAVYNDANQRMGVLGVDLSLGNINQFLQELKIGKSGEAFIIEKSGLLVASSTEEKPYDPAIDAAVAQRLRAKNSRQPMVREAAVYLEEKMNAPDSVDWSQNMQFRINGKNTFLKVLPYRDDRGIDWLIAVVIPEADFTEQIQLRQQNTILITGISIAGAIALGILTTQYINRPLRRLTLASQDLANGALDRDVNSEKILELDLLAQAFTQMATQLKASFKNLEYANENLELKIQERTTDLQASESKFRSLVANLAGIVYRCHCDSDWTMIFIGGAVQELTGYPNTDFEANQVRSWASIIHPDDRPVVERTIHESLLCNQHYAIEYRVINAQGRISWLSERGRGIFDEDGQLLWLDGAIFDIGDRKQVEAELLERVHLSILMSEISAASTQLATLQEVVQSFVESLWRHMNATFAQIWIANDDAQVEVKASAGQYGQATGDRLYKLVGEDKIWSITHGIFHPILSEQALANLPDADRQWIQDEGIVSIIGYPLLVNRQIIGMMLLVSHSHLDTDIQSIDLIANAIALGIDHKKSEDKLKSTNAEMSALFAAMDEVIFVRDRLGRILKIPETRRKVSWLTPEELIGKLPSEIYPADQVEQILIHVQQALDTQKTTNLEYSLPTEQQPVWWNASISPIDQDTVVWVARDLTERKESEQQLKQAKQNAEAASVAKGQFLASMSHELRTPLNAILGFTQLVIRDRTLKDSHRDYLKIIHSSGEHLLELINDVLDMSKIESGRITLNSTSFDLYHLLSTLEDTFRLRAKDKKLKMLFQRSPQVPQWISTDEGKLRQILINLLSNAIKFTEYGAVNLSVSLHELSDFSDPKTVTELKSLPHFPEEFLASANGESCSILQFRVEDTGAGIDTKDLHKIFEAFEQTAVGRLASEGTGLGLAISRRFAQLMGGQITVSSVPSQGSTFDVFIPVQILQSPVPYSNMPLRQILSLAPDQPPCRILVAEDRWESRHLLVKLLESIGFEVREAANGAEAIAIWEEWEPHLIWMDMRMPIVDGYDATRQIKSHLRGQATVIIALTASALEEEKTIILSAGCDDFVRKPFREALIFDKISEYLGVRYIYADDLHAIADASDQPFSISDEDLQAGLAQMPQEWLTQILQAATLADNDLITDLVHAIPADRDNLAKSVISLMQNFEYNQIRELAQTAIGKLTSGGNS